MAHTTWIVVFGGIFAFLNAYAVGANMLANCWGAVIGAKVVKYRTAVLLGIICELVGVLVFGPRVAVVYNGILNDWTVLKPYPGLALYALMWAEMTLVTWQFLAIWKQILVPVYLGFVASLIGASFVFPGVHTIDGGTSLSTPPFLSGLGPVFLVWLTAPAMALTLVPLVFLLLRTCLLRGEDPFHKVLWAMPVLGCGAAIIWGLEICFSISSTQGLQIVTWAPPGIVVLVTAIGSAGCVVTCLAVPRMQRMLRTRGPSTIPLKRMNLLGLVKLLMPQLPFLFGFMTSASVLLLSGLFDDVPYKDEATVRELAADERAGDMKGWLQRLHAWLFEGDIFASVASNSILLRIHSTAEEFEGAAEDCFVPLQVITSMFVTVAFSANNLRASVSLYAIMVQIYNQGVVSPKAPIGLGLRGFGAAGMCLGTLLCGFRLCAVTGAQIAKLTPFRSFVVTECTALTLTIMALLQLKGGTITYVIVTAVCSVGLAEGSSHVNWRKVRYTVVWWAAGFAIVMVSTAALVAQGLYAPSIVNTATTAH